MLLSTLCMLMTPIFSAMYILPKLQAHMSWRINISIWIRLSVLNYPTYFCSIPYSAHDNCILIDVVAKTVGSSWIPFIFPCPAPILRKLWYLWLQNMLISPLPFAAKLLKRVVCIIFSSNISWTHFFCEISVLSILLKLLLPRSILSHHCHHIWHIRSIWHSWLLSLPW